MVMDLFADQLTDVALKTPEHLSAALSNAGVFVDNSLDPKYLIEKVADNWDNKKLIQNVSMIISDVNSPKQPENLNGGGIDPVSAVAGAIGDVVKGAGQIAQAATATKTAKEANKGKMLDYLSAKQAGKASIADAQLDAKTKAASSKTTLIIGVAIVAAIILGVVIWKSADSETTPAQ